MRVVLALSSLALVAGLACSAFNPQVGPTQDACNAEGPGSAAPPAMAGYGSSAGGGRAPPLQPSSICTPDGGDACEGCESQFCCPTREACYEDPVCHCADQALDLCSESAGDDPKRLAACYAAFTGEGAVEKARVACVQTWCRAVCGLP
jgi:hypothetical protein